MAELEGEPPHDRVAGQAPVWPRGAASAAIFRGREVLLIQRGKSGPLHGFWSLPGGRIEAGEPARTAALREVIEETGIVAELAGLLDIHDVFRHEAGQLVSHYILAVFYGRWISGEPAASDDAMAARFFPIDAIDGLQMTDFAAGFIHRAWALLQETER
jgi:8-oxo-dGTP diphosphatase